VRVQSGALGQATIVTHAAVVPERGAVLGGREVVRAAPPSVVVNRTVITRNVPPPAPVAFEHQRTAMQSNPGRPLDSASMGQVRSSAPAPIQRPMYRQAPAIQPQPQTQTPNRTFGNPQGQPGQPRPMERTINPPAPQPTPQPTPQPRPLERSTPPASQPTPQVRPLERTNTPSPPQRDQKQERRDEKKPKREERREKEKEKG
jgi:hypothetical protein